MASASSQLLTPAEKQALLASTSRQKNEFPLMILEPAPSPSFNLSWKSNPPPDWLNFLLSYEAELIMIEAKLNSSFDNRFPQPHEIFRALYRCPSYRVLILGQDPYPGRDKRGRPYAHGLSFSTPSDRYPLPDSLQNVFKEVERDTGSTNRNPDLTRWALQGVLLLNTALTVVEGTPNSHSLTWKNFTEALLKELTRRYPKMICLLWGSEAKKWKKVVPKDHILETSHPSGRGVKLGFEGCGHFSEVNRILVSRGETPIEW